MPLEFGPDCTPLALPHPVYETLRELIDRQPPSERTTVLRSWLQASRGEKPRCSLGTLLATPGALGEIREWERYQALARHICGDWGELDAHDWLENDAALREQRRLLSAYLTCQRVRFWIITEWDRSATTILLPEEY